MTKPMGAKARDYKPSTKRRLDTLSGNECANPNCFNKFIAHDNETIISKIAHIEAASESGPRFNPNMSDDERRGFDNLILLCDECHSIVDNPTNVEKYTVELLKTWKTTHENKQIYEHIKNQSLLKIAVNAIANIKINENKLDNHTNQDLKPFKILEKIDYNSIKRNKSLIDEYKVYYSQINSLYDELERQGSFKKENLLRNIKNMYIKISGKYITNQDNKIEIIRENSDNIIEDIEDELFNLIGADEASNFSFEISIIIVDSFIRCKLLEEPV